MSRWGRYLRRRQTVRRLTLDVPRRQVASVAQALESEGWYVVAKEPHLGRGIGKVPRVLLVAERTVEEDEG